MALGMGLCVWFLRFRPFEKQPKCQHKDQGFSNRCRIGYPATELSTNGQHARVILANDHTAIAEKWTMNKSTYICPIEKSGIFQPLNLKSTRIFMGRFSTLQKSPVAWPKSRFLQTNLRSCLSVRQLYLPSATKRRTSWHHTQQLEMRQPGKKKGFFLSPLTAKTAVKRRKTERSVGREMHLIRFFFWKMLVQQLESVVKCPVLWVVFLMKIAFLSLAKITEILTVTKKMACVAVQHLSSIKKSSSNDFTWWFGTPSGMESACSSRFGLKFDPVLLDCSCPLKVKSSGHWMKGGWIFSNAKLLFFFVLQKKN